MSNLTTRAGKGSPLTNNELDANFTNLNADKVEVGGDLSGTATAPNVAKIQGRAVSSDAPEAGEKLVWNGSAWEPSTDPTGEPIGHADKSESTVSFNSGTRTFTIAPVAASFTVWCKGVKHTYTSAQTVVIPDTTGLHFIYFDASGVLSTQMTYFTWEEHAPTAYIYWNAATQQAVYFGDERHGITLDWQTHEYLHRTRGAAIASGFGASNYTTTGLGATDADAQIDIGGGTFFDEDLQVDIVSTNTPVAGTWQQDLSGPARIPVLYLSGSAWVIDAPTNFPFKVVSGVPQYNLYSGGTWSTASVANNEYFVTWILATHNLTYPVIAVISQALTNQLSAAEAMTFEGLNLNGFPSVEFRPLYKVIYQYKSGFTNSIKASTIAVYDLRSLQSAGVAAALVQDHGNLSGLGDDDHAQYLHVSEVRSPSAAVKNSFLPSQSGNSGKYLTTDGSNPSWGAIPSGSLTFTGDVTGTGNTGSSTTLTLANSGVTAGTFTKVTVDAKGRVTTGASISSSDVTTALGFTPERTSNKGIANGYASLDAGGKVPSTQLPSYVDDVLEYANLAAFPATGESGKIYIAIDTVKTYRWSGSAYVEITSSPGSTDAVPEGSTNLYFTNARARAAVSASGSLSYNVSTGIFSYTQPTNVSTFTNDSGYLTGITGTQVTTALGYTPLSPSANVTVSGFYNFTNANGININSDGYLKSGATGYAASVNLQAQRYNYAIISAIENTSNAERLILRGAGGDTSLYAGGVEKFTLAENNSHSLTGSLSVTGTITGTLSGNASSATALQTARTINGVSFDGTANITVGRLYDEGGSGSSIRLSSGNELEYYSAAGTIGTMYLNYSSADANSVRGPGGSTFINSSNYNSYALPLSGGSLTGTLNVTAPSTAEAINVYGRSSDNISEFNMRNNANSVTYGRLRGMASEIRLYTFGAIPLKLGANSGAQLEITSGGVVQIDGNVALHAGNYTNYHYDSRYYTESESDARFLRPDGRTFGVSAANLAVGWYTIAKNPGNRATGRFGVRDTSSSSHNAVTFYASHHYGAGNNITVIHASKYNATKVRYIRIKEGGTYDGALLQVYIEGATNSLEAYILGDNFQSDSWTIVNWVPDGTDPGGVGNFAALTNVAAQVDIDQVYSGGISTTGDIYFGNATSQSLALNAANYNSYALPLTGGTVTGSVSMTADAQGYAAPTLYVKGDIRAQRGTGNTGVIYFGNSSGTYLYYDGSNYYMPSGNLYVSNNLALHATNYSSYALPLSGGTLTGNLISGSATPTGNVLGNVRAYGSSSAYMCAADQSGRTAFFGVDSSGYAMFGAFTNHDAVIRANNLERIRARTNGNVDITSGALQIAGTTVIDFSRNLTNIGTISASGGSITGNLEVGVSNNNAAPGYLTRLSGASLSDGTGSYGSYGALLLNANSSYTSSARRWLVTNRYLANRFAIIRSIDSITDPSLGTGGAVSSGTVDLEISSTGTVSLGGYTALHANNYSSYALPLSGGTVSGATNFTGSLTATNSTDYQLTLSGNGTTWAGIRFIDSGGTDYLWFNGGSGTYSFGGGGSTVSGKKMHINGGVTIGSGYTATSNPTNGLNVEGAIQQAGNQVLHAGNYTSYSPSLAGSGASGTWGISVTGSAGSASTATRSTIEDTRAAQRTPDDYEDYRASYEFTDRITGLGDWHTAFTMQGWHNGYAAWQIIGPASTSAHENWYLRSGINTSWNTTRAILHAGNYSSYALPLSGGTISSGTSQALNLTTSSSGPWALGLTRSDAGVSSRVFLHNGSGSYVWVFEHVPVAYNGGSYNSFLTSGNYTSYSPSLTGSGASGTWGINVTGYAQTLAGTANSASLYANGTGSYGAWRMDGTRGSYTGFYLGNGGGVVLGMYDSGGNGGAWDSSASWHFYWHRGNACFGIGSATTSSSYKAYVAGALYATGNITAYSDVRKKENIVTIDGALDKVSRMRGVFYNRKDDDAKVRQVGVIAQEINEVLPEAVTYATDVDEYGVAYGNIVGVLIEAIKELRAEVSELKSKLH